jgi:hypothetical protein
MKNLIVIAALLLLPAAAAQAQVAIRFGWTAPPPLVEVSPGVQVVEDGGNEIFFTNGRYWTERDGRWYWSRDYHERWVYSEGGRVPLFLRNHRRGEYLHWRRAEHLHNGEVRHEARQEHREAEHRAAEHREVKREEKHEVKREVKHEEKRDEHRK